MKPIVLFVLSLILPLAAVAAQETPAETPVDTLEEPPGLIRPAEGLKPEDFMWLNRPVMVFADSPVDPLFVRQMELLARDQGELDLRDVVVIVDSDPAARSAFRQRFRPRGFSLVMMDKDGVTTLRKPLPWDVREITHAIDKFPTARQEMLDRYPSGR